MKFEHTSVYNIENALRGMRNPLNSWAKSDSEYNEDGEFIVGENDLGLAGRLISGGTEHRKFLRQIFVCVDITAPIYWWSEFDTYKVGTAANSTSTMHTLSKFPINKDILGTAFKFVKENMVCKILSYKGKQRVDEHRDDDDSKSSEGEPLPAEPPGDLEFRQEDRQDRRLANDGREKNPVRKRLQVPKVHVGEQHQIEQHRRDGREQRIDPLPVRTWNERHFNPPFALSGNVTVKVVPCPGVDEQVAVPP